jgi:enamine deaminase RidA (YjgF/YER057c/UK114 family)
MNSEAHVVDQPRPARRTEPQQARTAVRRFRGPIADELVVHCRPPEGLRDAGRQAEALYEALFDTLASEGADPAAVVSETVFFRAIEDDAERIHGARARVLGGAALHAGLPATTCIQQPPLESGAPFELSATALVPRFRGSSSTSDVIRTSACVCEACAHGVRAKVVRVGDHVTLHTGNIHGSGKDAFAEAYDMFRLAEDLLGAAGMHFGNVVRTWIHLRDVDRDYGALNEARRAFFRHCGLERRPASTGVQGIPASGAHDFSLSLSAVASPRPLDIAPMCTPLLNEAWTYGADFSRGLRIVDPNKVTLHVSGTASIDDAGRTVHLGDVEAQVDRMLHNIASLLARQGASFDDVVSGVTYLKRPVDAARVRAMFRRRGFDGFPCAVVEAPLCRPELLCEAEVVAMLPAASAGA